MEEQKNENINAGKIKLIVWSCLIVAIAFALCVFSSGFKNWNVKTWFKKTDTNAVQTANNENNDNLETFTIIVDGTSINAKFNSNDTFTTWMTSTHNTINDKLYNKKICYIADNTIKVIDLDETINKNIIYYVI